MRSKYCFRPEDLSSVVFWFDNVYTRAITEHPGDLFTLYVMRVQKRKRRTFGVFYLFISIYYKEILENLAFNTSEIDEYKKIIDEQENMNLLKTLFSRQHKRKSDSVNLKMWCTTETTK